MTFPNQIPLATDAEGSDSPVSQSACSQVALVSPGEDSCSWGMSHQGAPPSLMQGMRKLTAGAGRRGRADVPGVQAPPLLGVSGAGALECLQC